MNRLQDDSGTSIVELGVAMFVTALMSAAMVTWMHSAGAAISLHGGDDQAMQELRIAKSVIGRDLRSAESVLSAGTVSVTVWVDDDDDDFQDIGEAITWAVTEDGNLTRTTDGGEFGVLASNLVYGESYFGYDSPTLDDITEIGIQLMAHVVTVAGESGTRSIGVRIHVRNA
jgi:hypothetical protein